MDSRPRKNDGVFMRCWLHPFPSPPNPLSYSTIL